MITRITLIVRRAEYACGAIVEHYGTERTWPTSRCLLCGAHALRVALESRTQDQLVAKGQVALGRHTVAGCDDVARRP